MSFTCILLIIIYILYAFFWVIFHFEDCLTAIGIIIILVLAIYAFNHLKFLFSLFLILLILYILYSIKIDEQQQQLYNEILAFLQLSNINNFLMEYDDTVIVKSRRSLNTYNYLNYLKENKHFESAKKIAITRSDIQKKISGFLEKNDFITRPHYDYVATKLKDIVIHLSRGYRIRIVYITSAENLKDEKLLTISEKKIKEVEAHPEYLMTKTEYNRYLKQQAEIKLENKKHEFYDKVNSIIDFANSSKDTLISKEHMNDLSELIQQLFDSTISNIQRIKKIDSNEWDMLEKFINTIKKQTQKIVDEDKKINKYYSSEDFKKLKQTCKSLNASRKEFNEYIAEKEEKISKVFGTRIVRNKTQHHDTFNYIHTYRKEISPFVAEVSSRVFSSAENAPITYIVKYFYQDKTHYREIIQKLQTLIEELETLKEAKEIIDNYKKDYEQYIKNVPSYVLETDEKGFYSRLGLAIIDEGILNIEYKFTYTSSGGRVQRSFSVPMNEENINELINKLESKLSKNAFVKEQRNMMTTKLRMFIKKRDNFTCCYCGNSTKTEPNLLLEVDHIIPIAKGGLTQKDNLQTLCWKCNRNKGTKLI